MNNNLIALDADGVLVDYHAGYARAWKQAFGEELVEVDPNAYWAVDRFAAPKLDLNRRRMLRAVMDEIHWSTLDALPGALDACHELKESGYRLVCVTAINSKFREARMSNLLRLGFPIDEVYATGAESPVGVSPKAAALHALKPAAFVDDFAPYFQGISLPQSHLALITREESGSPNSGDLLKLAHSCHTDLRSFSRWWIDSAPQ